MPHRCPVQMSASMLWLPFCFMNMRFPDNRLNTIPLIVALIAIFLNFHATVASAAEIGAVTFATQPKKIYVPLEEAAGSLRWRIQRDESSSQIKLRKVSFSAGLLRYLMDGTELIAISDLEAAGARIERDSETGVITVASRLRRFTASVGVKRVEINLAKQQLNAWQGKRLVLQTRISSGRSGRTPSGNFRAGPYKARKHYSSLYNNAPMPWSVQVNGHVFVHGFTSVPDYPASHGCIRLPLTGRNPAKFFYEWVNVGTPIRVVKK